jgi:hypothetical protein
VTYTHTSKRSNNDQKQEQKIVSNSFKTSLSDFFILTRHDHTIPPPIIPSPPTHYYQCINNKYTYTCLLHIFSCCSLFRSSPLSTTLVTHKLCRRPPHTSRRCFYFILFFHLWSRSWSCCRCRRLFRVPQLQSRHGVEVAWGKEGLQTGSLELKWMKAKRETDNARKE